MPRFRSTATSPSDTQVDDQRVEVRRVVDGERDRHLATWRRRPPTSGAARTPRTTSAGTPRVSSIRGDRTFTRLTSLLPAIAVTGRRGASKVMIVPGDFGLQRIEHVHGNAQAHGRRDGARMQHLRAERRQLRRLVEPDMLDELGGLHHARIGGEHPVHVGPDLDGVGSAARRRTATRCSRCRRGPRVVVTPVVAVAPMKPPSTGILSVAHERHDQALRALRRSPRARGSALPKLSSVIITWRASTCDGGHARPHGTRPRRAATTAARRSRRWRPDCGA